MSTLLNRSIALACGLMFAATIASAADSPWKRKPRGPEPSPGAIVTQMVNGSETITIAYHRPGVKGRQVWKDKSPNAAIGSLVPHDEDPRPWRAGANEATKITFSADVKVQGEKLAAGTYSLFLVPTDGDWTVIFNNTADQWGSFTYKKEADALRVTATPVEAPHQERLVYGFDDLGDTSVTAFMHWEKVKLPFSIELDL